MPSSRVMRSVLHNVLGAYVSRYSDYNGYWVFGFLVPDLNELRIDLLATEVAAPEDPVGAATLLAVTRFQEQVRKARVDLKRIAGAGMVLRRSPSVVQGLVNGHVCQGYQVSVAVTATMATQSSYKDECAVFVAPHSPQREVRSVRAVA
jgi:hypothetical protein